jgi:hypothetical protein
MVLVVFDDEIDVLASGSSFVTEVTVMKFLAVANRVAIIQRFLFKLSFSLITKSGVLGKILETASK